MRTIRAAIVGLVVALPVPAILAHQPPAKPAAVAPVPRTDAWWTERHERVVVRNHTGPVDLIFIGDSITQGWEEAGQAAWDKSFAPLHAANLGFSGDRTQHVLWRLDHGEVDDIHPKAAVIMIGTNNSNGKDHTAPEIAEGIKAIVAKLREKLPETKILLLAIFPRGDKPNPQRDKLAAVNAEIAKLADGKAVRFLDIGPRFTAADGTISKEIMPDFLHLSPKGYEIWAEAIGPAVGELIGTGK